MGKVVRQGAPSRLALATIALFLALAGVASSASSQIEPGSNMGRTAADPKFGAFFGTSADGLPAFLHVTPFGLRARIRTAAIAVKATCISDGASGRTSLRIGVNGQNILVGRDGRFTFRRQVTENQTLTTYKIQGVFAAPDRATGTASVTSLTQGDGLATVTCGSGTKRFVARLR